MRLPEFAGRQGSGEGRALHGPLVPVPAPGTYPLQGGVMIMCPWECPKCGTVIAPWVAEHRCEGDTGLLSIDQARRVFGLDPWRLRGTG